MVEVKEVKARLKDLVGMNVYLEYTGVNRRSRYKGVLVATVESMGRTFVKLAGYDNMRVSPNQELIGEFGDRFNLFLTEDEAKDAEKVKNIARAVMTKFPSVWSYDKVPVCKMIAIAEILGIEY